MRAIRKLTEEVDQRKISKDVTKPPSKKEKKKAKMELHKRNRDIMALFNIGISTRQCI